jgi:hypothetical protein
MAPFPCLIQASDANFSKEHDSLTQHAPTKLLVCKIDLAPPLVVLFHPIKTNTTATTRNAHHGAVLDLPFTQNFLTTMHVKKKKKKKKKKNHKLFSTERLTS